MRKLMMLVGIATMSSPSFAADWRWLTSTRSGSVIYYDEDTLRTDGNRARVWIRIDLKRDRTTKFRETLELWSYDCRQRTTLAISAVDYLPDGKSVERRQLRDDPYDYTPVIPESIAETAMRKACR